MSLRALAPLVVASLLAPAPPPAAAAEVWGRVFRDRNGDGLPDPGEEGLAEASVEVFGVWDDGGIVDRTVVTGSDGSFFLGAPDLAEGCFVTRVMPPAGFRLGPARRDCPGRALGWPVGSRRYASPRGLIDALRANALLHIALGDSIAEPASFLCTGVAPPFNLADYIGWFGERLRCLAPGAATSNQAIGGKRTRDLLMPAGTCGPPNLPHGGGDRCDNIFDTIAQGPGLVTISIGGNDFLAARPTDQTEPFDAAELARSVEALLDTRRNLQEILSTLATELPATDVIVNTVYDNRAGSCASTDFHRLWVPLWNQVLRDVAWGQGERFHVAEVEPDYAHQDLNGASCCGERGLICGDGIHPTANGARVHLEKVWEAAGGVNLGPGDPLGTTANPDLLFPVEELVAVRFPTAWEDPAGRVLDPARALARDGEGARVPSGDGAFVLRGFDARPMATTPTRVVAVVRYRTDAAPPPAPEGDPYWVEASVDGSFAPPEYRVTGWNTIVPIVGAAAGAPAINALPDVPEWREVRALLTKNLLEDGRATGSYTFPTLTWSDVATLAVRLRGAAAGSGPDAYHVELDTAWVEVYGYAAPGTLGVYRSDRPDRLLEPASLLDRVAGTSFDDLPPPADILYYRVDDGTGFPARIDALRLAPGGVRLTW